MATLPCAHDERAGDGDGGLTGSQRGPACLRQRRYLVFEPGSEHTHLAAMRGRQAAERRALSFIQSKIDAARR